MLFCWEIAREKKERYGSSSFWSIEQLVVVISYKNHFTLLQLTREKYFGTFYDVDRKREVFSFSLVFIAFNSTRARAFYFSLFLPFSSSSVSIFSQKQFFPKSREEKRKYGWVEEAILKILHVKRQDISFQYKFNNWFWNIIKFSTSKFAISFSFWN